LYTKAPGSAVYFVLIIGLPVVVFCAIANVAVAVKNIPEAIECINFVAFILVYFFCYPVKA